MRLRILSIQPECRRHVSPLEDCGVVQKLLSFSELHTVTIAMDHPRELRDLLAELEAAAAGRNVPSLSPKDEAHAVVHINRRQLVLNRHQCDLLFETAETAELLFSALGAPDASELTLHGVVVDEEVMNALTSSFDKVAAADEEEDEP